MEWISAEQLTRRWGGALHDVAQAIMGGLPVYRKPDEGPPARLDNQEIEALMLGFRNPSQGQSPTIGLDWIKEFRARGLHVSGAPDDETKGIRWFPVDIWLKMEDITAFEAKSGCAPPPGAGVTGRDAIELGQLRREKAKWDESLRAAIEAAHYCSTRRATKGALYDHLLKAYPDMAQATFGRIWAALPPEMKNRAGRPPNKTSK